MIPMRRDLGLIAVLCLAWGGSAAAQAQHDLRDGHLRVGIREGEGGALHAFGRNAGVANLAGPSGLLNEGLRLPNAYLPERRADESITHVEETRGVPTLAYRYTVDGLEVERRMTPVPGGAALRCVWTVRNGAREPRDILPWVGNDIRPGGSVDTRDAAYLPTVEGVGPVQGSGWRVPTQGWFAAVDPIEQEALVALFDASRLGAVQVGWDAEEARGFEAAFRTETLAPGARWETTYQLAVVTGLTRVDGAGAGFVAQAEINESRLAVRVATLEPGEAARIEARLRAASGAELDLAPRPVAPQPGVAARVEFPLPVSPQPGALLQLRLLRGDGTPLPGAPSGDGWVDVATSPESARLFNASVAPPRARAPRVLSRPPAWRGDAGLLWFEPALEKVFREDRVDPVGDPDPVAYLVCARNEAESFQIAIQPATPWRGVHIVAEDLARVGGGGRIPASQITVRNVAHVPIAVSSHFDGSSGLYPDPLPAHAPFDAAPGANRAVWATVRVPADTPPGDYEGALRVTAQGIPAISLTLAVHVHPATLPAVPALASDVAVGSDPGGAMAALLREYRLTARQEGASEHAAMAALRDAAAQRGHGLSSVYLPPLSTDDPDALARLDAAVVAHGLAGVAFTEPAIQPAPEHFPAVVDVLVAWRRHAPNIAARVPTAGLDPFLPEGHPHWTVHWPIFQTTANKPLLRAINAGTRVWADVGDLPGPPFASLCIDRPGIEHRILGWQAWALGVAGLRLWSGETPGGGAVDAQGVWRGPDLGGDIPAHGAGMLAYPGAGGPVPSIRLEILRDAVEDHGLLSLLVARLTAALEAPDVPGVAIAAAQDALGTAPLMRTLTDFSRNPIDLLEHRMRVLDALEMLE